MCLEIESVRPSLLNEKTYAIFNDFRSFRHVARHAYSFQLKPDKLLPLLKSLPASFELLQQAIARFWEILLQADGHESS